MPDRIPAPPDPWTVAIHRSHTDQEPIGAGVVIDPYRVLTCAHVVRSGEGWEEPVWVGFPKAGGAAWNARRRVRHVAPDPLPANLDLVVLELAEPVPDSVTPARLRCVPASQLVNRQWWAFGFPGGAPAGDEARGMVAAALAFGQIKLSAGPESWLEGGFSGSGVWSPDYQAVVGLVVAAAAAGHHAGKGHALTLHGTHEVLPELGLADLSQWTAADSDEAALAAWGWTLHQDPETGRHWWPRARGTIGAGEPGYCFRGRDAALTAIVRWLDRAAPDRRVLVVTGSPGAGKSAVLGRAVTTADPELQGQLPGDDRAVRATVGSVACAVHAKGKTAREVAIEIARAASVRLPESPEELVPRLRQRLVGPDRTTAGGGGRFNLVVDALDEMAPTEARQLVRAVLLPLAGLGPELDTQVVVGTRRGDAGGDLLGAFGGRAQVVDLDHPDYFARADLVAYAAALRHTGALDPATEASAAERIATMAGRNFLVAGLIARTRGSDAAAPTVDAALEAYLAGLDPAGTTPARLALAVLAYAEAPGLPLPLWQAGVAALGGEASEAELADFARSAASFLVETNTGPAVRAYRLFHQALADALRHERDALGAQAADQRWLFEAWLRAGRGAGWSGRYDYLLRSLPVHARRAGRIDELLADDRFLLHADLRRLVQAADVATTDLGRARARLLQLTPLAVAAGPGERAALFSVTEQLDKLGSGFGATGRAPYRARWAHALPRHERAALEGHADGVLGVAALPRGGLASAGADGTVRLWDAATGQPVRVFAGHTGPVRSVAPVPAEQGHLLASAGDDRTVRLWDPATGQCRHTLTGHTDWVRAVAAVAVPTGHRLASASDDGTVRIWNPATGHCDHVLNGHTGWVTALSPVEVGDRTLLAAAGYDRRIRLWDPVSGELLSRPKVPASWVTALCAVRVGGRDVLAVAGYDAPIWLWEPTTGGPEWTLPGEASLVTGLCPVTDGRRTLLAVSTEQGTVSLRDPVTGERVHAFDGHTEAVRDACAVPVGTRRLLASAGDDGAVRLWDPGSGRPERVLDGMGPVTGVAGAPGPGGQLLASTSRDGSVRLWHPDTGARRSQLAGHTGAVTRLCPVTVEQRQLLASAGQDRCVQLWDLDNRRLVRTLAGDYPAATDLCAVPAPDGDRLAVASDSVRLWHPATGQMERVFSHLCWVTAVCTVPAPEGTLLASADEDGVVRLWDPATGALARELRSHYAAATALCAVPGGGRMLLASASADHTIALWDPQTGERVAALAGHTAAVTGLCAVSSGGEDLLVSTSLDRTARLWDPAAGSLRLTIPTYHRALACWSGGDADPGGVVLGLDDGLLAIGLDIARTGPPGYDQPDGGVLVRSEGTMDTSTNGNIRQGRLVRA